MGDPEFELVLASRTSSAEQFNREIQCAGEHAAEIGTNQPGIRAPEFVYDQNGNYWSGAVLVATLEQLQQAQASDTASMVMIWEDDNDACRIRKGQTATNNLIAAAAAAASTGRAFLQGNVFSGVISAAGMAQQLVTLMSNLQSDDPVGAMTP